MLRTDILALSFAALTLMTACGGGDEFVGSCNIPEMDDGSVICIDATADGEELTRGLCRIAGGDWNTDQSCNASAAIAGCQQTNGSVMWMYPSEKTGEIDDVIASCKGRVITDRTDL